MATQKKIDSVNLLTDKINKSKSIIFADYKGLKHKQLEELRRNLAKVNGEFKIVKNRLFKRALGSDKSKDAETQLKQTTAVLFSYEDEVSPLKELKKFFKTAIMGNTKGGFLGNNVLTDQDVNRLASIPPREILLGQLAGQLKAPISGLHYALSWNLNKLAWVLNGIKDKKSN